MVCFKKICIALNEKIYEQSKGQETGSHPLKTILVMGSPSNFRLEVLRPGPILKKFSRTTLRHNKA